MILSGGNNQSGTTLVETMIAGALSALFLGSLFAMNSSSMATIKMARDAACASQVLQQRIEGLRIANWHQITDATWLQDNLLNTSASGASQLRNFTETLMLIPYDSSTPGNTKLARSGNQASIVSKNTALLGENAIKVVWTVNYLSVANDTPVTRQTVAIIAKGGVAK